MRISSFKIFVCFLIFWLMSYTFAFSSFLWIPSFISLYIFHNFFIPLNQASGESEGECDAGRIFSPEGRCFPSVWRPGLCTELLGMWLDGCTGGRQGTPRPWATGPSPQHPGPGSPCHTLPDCPQGKRPVLSAAAATAQAPGLFCGCSGRPPRGPMLQAPCP